MSALPPRDDDVRFDVDHVMDRALAANKADIAQHRRVLPTLADTVEVAYESFGIGLQKMTEQRFAEAIPWLTTAVDNNIEAARPMLEICIEVADPNPARRTALGDEREDALARQLASDEAEEANNDETPIFDTVLTDQRGGEVPAGAQPKEVPEPAHLVLPHPGLLHGAGYHRLVEWSTGSGEHPTGLTRNQLITPSGMVIPSAIGVSHKDQAGRLRQNAAEALGWAMLVGDLVFDRIAASCARCEEFRGRFEVPPGQKLIAVTSTWGEHATMTTAQGLVRHLLGQLSMDRYRVLLIMHPNVWSANSPAAATGSLREDLDRGLVLVPARVSWEADLTAADLTLGDHASLSIYAEVSFQAKFSLLDTAQRERHELTFRMPRHSAASLPSAGVEPWCPDDLVKVYGLAAPWPRGRSGPGLLLPRGSEAASGPTAPTPQELAAFGEIGHRVAFLAARGMPGVDIAAELGLPHAAAIAHFVRVCRKLGVTDREGLRATLDSAGWWDSRPDDRASAQSGV